MFRKFLLTISVAMAVFGAAIVANASTFDGNPAGPLPLTTGYTDAGDGATYDVQVHSRDQSSWMTLPAIDAQHGGDCAGPPATHTNTSYEGSVFICRDHVMTAINGSAGYAVIYLTPNRLLDFSQGGVVEFELSTQRMSTRDWWDVTVSPFLDAQALPLLSDLSQGVDLQEPNRNGIVIATDNGEGAPNLKVTTNGATSGYDGSTPFNTEIAAGTNQAATRQPFRLTISPTHVRFERLASASGSGVVFIDRDIPALSWTQGVLQLGHHSYNPTKEGSGVPATWHWDNVSLSPSAPFTMIKADRRYTQGGRVSFASPAPANAYLRFSAICKPVVDGVGLTKQTDSGHPEHAASYFVPIAEGTQSVNISFADDGWYTTNLGCIAKDFSIWSLSSGGGIPTDTPTSTPSVASPTSTPTTIPPPPTATSTAIPPTATPTPIPPTATPTPARCRVQVRNLSNTGWTYSIARGSYEGTLVGGECRR